MMAVPELPTGSSTALPATESFPIGRRMHPTGLRAMPSNESPFVRFTPRRRPSLGAKAAVRKANSHRRAKTPLPNAQLLVLALPDTHV